MTRLLSGKILVFCIGFIPLSFVICSMTLLPLQIVCFHVQFIAHLLQLSPPFCDFARFFFTLKSSNMWLGFSLLPQNLIYLSAVPIGPISPYLNFIFLSYPLTLCFLSLQICSFLLSLFQSSLVPMIYDRFLLSQLSTCQFICTDSGNFAEKGSFKRDVPAISIRYLVGTATKVCSISSHCCRDDALGTLQRNMHNRLFDDDSGLDFFSTHTDTFT